MSESALERHTERERGMDSVHATGMCTRVCVRERERDSVCESYIAPGSCYGHILITHSMLDYVLWACNITPSGQSPNRFSVSWPLAGKKNTYQGTRQNIVFSSAALVKMWAPTWFQFKGMPSPFCLPQHAALSLPATMNRAPGLIGLK